MDAQMAKELKGLHFLLDNHDADGRCGSFYYDEYFDRGNTRILRGSVANKELIDEFFLPDNPESSELDWWIIYALTSLKISDSDSIIRFLQAYKRRHPELAYKSDDPKLIRKRLNFLVKKGILMMVVYATNTNIDLSQADEVLAARNQERLIAAEKEKNLEFAKSLDKLFVYDGEEDEEEESDDIEYITYNNHDYSAYLENEKKNYKERTLKSLAGSKSRTEFQELFGKNARKIQLYALENNTHHIMRSRHGEEIPKMNTNPIYQFSTINFGNAAVAKVASLMMTMPSFTDVLSGKFWSKMNGIMYMPVEMIFNINHGGSGIEYDVGVFYGYRYKCNGRTTEAMVKRSVQRLIYQMKNFIGIKGDLKGEHPERDAFVVVVVNDMKDLLYIMETLKRKVPEVESHRIFFTGEGIVNSEAGVVKMLGFRLDPESGLGYQIIPVTLPL